MSRVIPLKIHYLISPSQTFEGEGWVVISSNRFIESEIKASDSAVLARPCFKSRSALICVPGRIKKDA